LTARATLKDFFAPGTNRLVHHDGPLWLSGHVASRLYGTLLIEFQVPGLYRSVPPGAPSAANALPAAARHTRASLAPVDDLRNAQG